jgi:outer membrane protein OmpA-like peptidoglycan-associated protein
MKIAYRFLFILLISMFLFGCGDKTAGVEGKIVDGKGKPVSGVSMIFKQVQPTQGYEQFETKTGTDGVFRLTGLAPSCDYIITLLSDKWKTKVSKKVKTLEAGQNLALTDPIKIRFNQMKDGTVVDTKTGLQWLIYPISDITASNVGNTVKGLKVAGFTDWRLPSREELAGLQEEKTPAKTSAAETVLIIKTCCAWVAEPNAEADWKFYVEEDNELWTSSKVTPDNRIIVVRNSVPLPAVSPAAGATPVASVAPTVQGQKANALKAETPSVKSSAGVRHASRKACAEKRAQAARLSKTTPVTAPANKQNTAKVVNTTPAKMEPTRTPSQSKKAEPVKIAEPAQSSMTASLYFDAGSAVLKTQELEKLKALLAKSKGGKGTLIIDGHSDASSGNSSSNLMLSVNRSSSVVAALNKMGVNKNIKVEIRAVGDGKPAASNDTTEGRKLNRRVDLSFVPE